MCLGGSWKLSEGWWHTNSTLEGDSQALTLPLFLGSAQKECLDILSLCLGNVSAENLRTY